MWDRRSIIAKTEELMKKYNIPPENIAADRATLNWLFLSKGNT